MSYLSRHQKQLLFNYSLGLTSEEEIGQAEQLITCNKQAAEILSKLKAVFEPLDSIIKPEPCRDELAERTIQRLCEELSSQQSIVNIVP
jgi:anti-sigma-K factor RskA